MYAAVNYLVCLDVCLVNDECGSVAAVRLITASTASTSVFSSTKTKTKMHEFFVDISSLLFVSWS